MPEISSDDNIRNTGWKEEGSRHAWALLCLFLPSEEASGAARGSALFYCGSPCFSNIKPQRMKRLKWPPKVSTNLLKATHILFSQAMIGFRNKVLEECGWSMPTFYRKMRGTDSLSNAEKDKILQIAQECVKHEHDYCTKLADDRKKGKPPLRPLTGGHFKGSA